MANNIPKKFILSIKPKEYLVQGPSHCGVYSVKGILSAYGKDNKKHPKEYHSNWFRRETSLTWGKNYYADIFQKYGISAEENTAQKLPNNDKTNRISEYTSKIV